MPLRKLILSFVLSLTANFCGSLAAVAQENWAVTLTSKQAKGVQEASAGRSHVAVAISPDGPWGWSEGMKSEAAAKLRALQFCRGFMDKGDRDCILYLVNGKVVAPAVVQTRRVSEVYKPLNYKRAASVFGISPLNFDGNLSQARAVVSSAQANPKSLRQDKTLRAALQGRTLMKPTGRPFAIWLGQDEASQVIKGDSGIITAWYPSWVVSADGVVCMLDGRWKSTGKRVGNKCFILGAAKRGKTAIYWESSANAKRDVILIAGDARYGAVR